MFGVEVRKENAEKIRNYLRQKSLLDIDCKIFSKDNLIYIPILRRPAAADTRMLSKSGCKVIDASFGRQSGRKPDRHAALRNSLDKEKIRRMSWSYDVLGNIATIESEPRYAKELAKAIMLTNRNVRTVLRKGGAVSGRYRTRQYRYVSGERKFVANYRENGCIFRFDVRKVFFSPRLAYERKRIASAAKDGENVLVMFSGVGPFAIECAKAHPNSKVVAIELNRQAHLSALENIKLNKVSNVTAVFGDVKNASGKYRRFADRIIMPLPKDSYNYLNSVVTTAKSPCTVHYYAFGETESAFDEQEEKIRDFFKKHGKSVRFAFERAVRSYSPTEIEIVIDFICSDSKRER